MQFIYVQKVIQDHQETKETGDTEVNKGNSVVYLVFSYGTGV